jgi:hypothetical protein
VIGQATESWNRQRSSKGKTCNQALLWNSDGGSDRFLDSMDRLDPGLVSLGGTQQRNGFRQGNIHYGNESDRRQ